MNEAAATDLSTVVIVGGFVLAFVFGLIANKTNFCTMGALSDIVNMGHWGRMRMWLLAIAVAMVGTAALSAAGLIDVSRAVMARPVLPWLSLLVGGLLFGVGMTMAGGCANRNLVRLGSGSVRSLVVLTFMAIASYMTLKGLFGQWRASFLDPVAIDLAGAGWPDQSLATAVARATGLPAGTALAVTAGVFGLALLVFTFMDKRFRANFVQVVGGVVIGLVVVQDQVDLGRHLDHIGTVGGDHAEKVGHARLEPTAVGDDHAGILDRLPVAQRDLERMWVGAGRDDCGDGSATGDF